MKQLILAGAILAFAVPASGQQASNPAAQQQAPDPATQQFVQKAAISDMFEIQSSELAAEKSQQAQIREFAQKIVQDHRKSTEELKSLIKRSLDLQAIQLPTALDSEHQQKIQQLRSTSGARFDEQYRAMQVQGHEQAVKMFESYAQSGHQAELKKWAEGKVPVLRNHLQMAQALPQSPPAAVAGAPSQQSQQPRGSTSQQGQMAPTAQTGQAQSQTGATQDKMRALAAPGPNHILASDLRGTRVRGANNENIGDINDVVLDRDGKVVAVVVGVGGFLGIGEKDVAIPFDALEIVAEGSARTGATRDTTSTGTNRTGSATRNAAQTAGTLEPERIVLRGMTKQDLEQAPKFQADGGQNR